MSYINDITQFIFDGNRKLSTKATVVVFVIIGILAIDNILGFSYSYNTNNKIEQVQKLNSIINNPHTDIVTEGFAKRLRDDVINREDFITQSFSFVRNYEWISEENTQSNDVVRSDFWFHVSAGGWYYLVSILVVPLGLIIMFSNLNKLSFVFFFQRLGGALLICIIFWGSGFLFSGLCALIPQISHSTWLWNYLLNGAIQMLPILIVARMLESKKNEH
jgi:hypothetical protein